MRTICLLLLPETMSSVLLGAFDVLSSAGSGVDRLTGAGDSEALFRPQLVGLSKAPVRCFNGVVLQPAFALDDIDRADYVFLPPIWTTPQAQTPSGSADVQQWLQQLASRHTTLTSACTGSLLIAAAGLLDGRAATTHWAFAQRFRREYPRVDLRAHETLVDSRGSCRIITAGGHSSWQNLLLHLIRLEAGDAAALQVARLFLMQWQTQGQLPYACLLSSQAHDDALIRVAEQRLLAEFDTARVLERAREATGLAVRSFSRRFKLATGMAPLDYLHRARLEAAKRRLERGEANIERLAHAVGYEDVSFFRRLFRRHAGLTPAAYRRRFELPAPAADDPGAVARGNGAS